MAQAESRLLGPLHSAGRLFAVDELFLLAGLFAGWGRISLLRVHFVLHLVRIAWVNDGVVLLEDVVVGLLELGEIGELDLVLRRVMVDGWIVESVREDKGSDILLARVATVQLPTGLRGRWFAWTASRPTARPHVYMVKWGYAAFVARHDVLMLRDQFFLRAEVVLRDGRPV